MAAWTRMEFLLYDAVPLLLLMGVLARPVPLAPADKDTLLFTHAGPLLFWVSGWFLVLFTFKTPLDSRVNALSVGCGLIWLAVLAFRIRGLRFSKAGLGVAAVLAPLLFLGLLWADRGNLAAVAGSISIAVFRTVVVHGFYVFTSLMVLWIFWNGLRTLNRGQKLLGVLLGFYLLVHFAVFSYSVPKWDTLAEFVRFTFIEPGRSVNLSDTRSMLGLYPSLVFFVAGLPRLKRRFG
ncbi:MAG: hypothetical protein GWN38_09015, partial [Nitrospinaceae bacterium]|nr:hypothetical protein [Nitrospinaceae bacterium]